MQLKMNSQIKEIAERCGLGSERWDTTKQFENFLNKFAERIVRESARIADRKYLYSTEPNRWDSGFNISCDILEHFGLLEDE